jgi:hypothetical protein
VNVSKEREGDMAKTLFGVWKNGDDWLVAPVLAVEENPCTLVLECGGRVLRHSLEREGFARVAKPPDGEPRNSPTGCVFLDRARANLAIGTFTGIVQAQKKPRRRKPLDDQTRAEKASQAYLEFWGALCLIRLLAETPSPRAPAWQELRPELEVLLKRIDRALRNERRALVSSPVPEPSGPNPELAAKLNSLASLIEEVAPLIEGGWRVQFRRVARSCRERTSFLDAQPFDAAKATKVPAEAGAGEDGASTTRQVAGT